MCAGSGVVCVSEGIWSSVDVNHVEHRHSAWCRRHVTTRYLRELHCPRFLARHAMMRGLQLFS